MVDERTVKILKSPTKGFGFSLIGGSNTHLPPMICALVQDSPAARSGEVGKVIITTIKSVNCLKITDYAMITRALFVTRKRSHQKLYGGW